MMTPDVEHLGPVTLARVKSLSQEFFNLESLPTCKMSHLYFLQVLSWRGVLHFASGGGLVLGG